MDQNKFVFFLNSDTVNSSGLASKDSTIALWVIKQKFCREEPEEINQK